jgi:hypothetical protein
MASRITPSSRLYGNQSESLSNSQTPAAAATITICFKSAAARDILANKTAPNTAVVGLTQY